ncbi:MAG: hypothetical protein ABIP06_06435 [Pyrinomonadaceae bacterium]
MKYPEIRITGLQFKSAPKIRKFAQALDVIEVECGIKVCRIVFVGCFFCPDIDWAKLQRTPMQRLIARVVVKLERQQKSRP